MILATAAKMLDSRNTAERLRNDRITFHIKHSDLTF